MYIIVLKLLQIVYLIYCCYEKYYLHNQCSIPFFSTQRKIPIFLLSNYKDKDDLLEVDLFAKTSMIGLIFEESSNLDVLLDYEFGDHIDPFLPNVLI